MDTVQQRQYEKNVGKLIIYSPYSAFQRKELAIRIQCMKKRAENTTNAFNWTSKSEIPLVSKYATEYDSLTLALSYSLLRHLYTYVII